MTVQPAQPGTAVAAAGTLGGYLADYNTLREIMAAAIRTEFVPAHFRPEAYLPKNERPTPELRARAEETAIVSACIGAKFGLSLGLGGRDGDPFMALQGVYVISGKPSLYAEAMEAIVFAAGHEMWTEESTSTRAIVCGRRAGSEHTERAVVTMDMATRAGWTNRNPKYKTEPDTMLLRRAQSRCARNVAPDALRGIRSREELEDETDAPGAANGHRTVQRARPAAVEPPAPVERPPLPGEGEEQPQPAEDAATDAQLRKLGAVFTDLGVKGSGERAQRLRIASEFVGRPLTSSRDLTKAEAQTLIDTLEGLSPEDRQRVLHPFEPEPAAPALPVEDPPADPWHINDATTEDDGDGDDTGDELFVPGDQS